MAYIYKPVKFREDKWETLKELADMLSEERGIEVSIPDAATEAAKLILDKKKADQNEVLNP